jgi:arsenite methyltransferase
MEAPELKLPISDLSCCADLYAFPLVRALLGDSLHPGGLALTRAAVKLLELSKNHHLLDVACGPGASALMLAQVYKCRVTGVDVDASAIRAARQEARRYRLHGLVNFIEADAARLPFASSQFDAALCECASNLLENRQAALLEMARVLRPGGYLALTDVTFRPDKLPDSLDHPLAKMLCVPLGLGPEDLADDIEQAGLQVQDRRDYSGFITEFLNKLGAFFDSPLTTVDKQDSSGTPDPITAALGCAHKLVEEGNLGYWGFTARKGRFANPPLSFCGSGNSTLNSLWGCDGLDRYIL